MKHNYQLLAVLLIALVSALNVPAQAPTYLPSAIQVLVGEVSDYRTTAQHSSQCVVELKFIGDATTDALGITRLRTTKAVDDLNKLLSAKDSYPELISETPLKREPGPLKQLLVIQSPSRRASFIKLLEGEVELFCPAAANGGLITIKDFFDHSPTPVQDPALKRLGIEVVYLSKATFESKKAEFARNRSIFGNRWPDPKANGRIFVTDAGRVVRSLEVQYADGTSFAAQSLGYLDQARVINLNAMPPSGSQLRITAFAPGTRQTYSFKLENIPLP